MEFVKILNPLTDNTFTLPEEDAREVMISNPNFIVVEGKNPIEQEEVIEPPKGLAEIIKGENLPDFENMKNEQLKDYCKRNQIDITGLRKNADIIARIKGE